MNEEIFGTDYSAEGELSSTGDLMLISGLNNAKQQIKNDILTYFMTYDYLSPYGSEIRNIYGLPVTGDTLSLFELMIIDCLNNQPRVDEILELHSHYDDKIAIGEMNLLLVDGSVIDLRIMGDNFVGDE